jgi:hypothetical protein
MKEDTKYNGWTNYATWRINLEIFDGFNILDFYPDTEPDLHELSVFLENYVDEILQDDSPNGLCYNYAHAFVSGVNWYEIAKHLIENYKEATE